MSMVKQGPMGVTAAAAAQQGDLEARVFDLMSKKKTDVQIVQALRIPIAMVKGLRKDYGAQTGDGAVGVTAGFDPSRRADRNWCARCGALQSQHEKGSGRCQSTLCPSFLDQAELEVAAEDAPPALVAEHGEEPNEGAGG
jgi:hypothetical protein